MRFEAVKPDASFVAGGAEAQVYILWKARMRRQLSVYAQRVQIQSSACRLALYCHFVEHQTVTFSQGKTFEREREAVIGEAVEMCREIDVGDGDVVENHVTASYDEAADTQVERATVEGVL